MKSLRCVVGCGLGLWALTSCATPPPAEKAPISFSVREDGPSPPAPGACGAIAVAVADGAVPAGASVLSRVEVTASAPAPMADVHALLKVRAARLCAAGVAVVKAEMADGATGVTAVTAVIYGAAAEAAATAPATTP